ncbi:helix-turn-helix domain-containing protein [Leptospira sp. 96542]|nr:helix-turn-helix domain-containing protein [Leptospira sp. 96542]
MRAKFWLVLVLLAFFASNGCLHKPEGLYGENISGTVEVLGSPLANDSFHCDLSSFALVSDLHWAPNPSKEAVRASHLTQGRWVRFSLSNGSDLPRSLTILVQWVNLPKVEICSETSKGDLLLSDSGYEWEDWLWFLSPFPHFNATLNPLETRTFYLRLVSNENINYPIRIVSEKMFRGIVLFRILTFLFFVMVAFVSLLWASSEYLQSKQVVYLTIFFHNLIFFLLVYSVHGKELVSLFGNQNIIIKRLYYFFLFLNHFVLFCYMASFAIFNEKSDWKDWKFWIVAASGIFYLFVPIFPQVYEYRIFLLLILFGGAYFYLFQTHKVLLQKENKEETTYFVSWILFLTLVFFKTLYHFDFYPYQPFFIYASVFYLPFLTAGSFLFLRNFEKRTPNKLRFRNSISQIEISKYLENLIQLMEVDKIYLEINCNEENVANRLGITYHQLSELVNSEYKINFPTLLNQYRVKEATNLLVQNKEINVADIGKMSGFGSRSAFYLEFKKQMGTNPNEYRKSMKPE